MPKIATANKTKARWMHYLRLLQLLTQLPATASQKWLDKQPVWEAQARQLAATLVRDFEHDRSDFTSVVVDAVSVAVSVNDVVGKPPRWTRPPSRYSTRVSHPGRVAAHSA